MTCVDGNPIRAALCLVLGCLASVIGCKSKADQGRSNSPGTMLVPWTLRAELLPADEGFAELLVFRRKLGPDWELSLIHISEPTRPY